MKRRRRTIRENCLWALENDGLEVLFAFFVLYIVIKLYNISFDRLFDLTIATSLIAFYAIRMLGKSISKNLKNKLEDDVKLDAKYEELVNRYPLNHNFVSYKNVIGDQFKLMVKKSEYKESAEYGYKVPLVEEFCSNGERIYV